MKNVRAAAAKIVLPSAMAPALVEYQSDAVEIEQAGPAPIAHISLYAAMAAILFAIGWASLSKIDVIVVGTGRTVSTAQNVVMAPLETSVIRSIDVEVGDLVRAGTPLAHLDPTFSEADVQEQKRRISSLDAQIARDRDELAGVAYAPGASPSTDELLQLTIANDRQAQYRAEIGEREAKIAQDEAEIETRTNEAETLEQRLKVVGQVEDMRQQLERLGSGSKLSLLQAQDSRLDVERSLNEAKNEITELQHQRDGARAELQDFQKKWRQDLEQDLITAQRDWISAAQQLEKATRLQQMVVLTTPVDAVVLDIAPRSVGSVMREAETLFTLVPIDVPLEVEARIAARDIGDVAVGDDVRVKLEAFPYQQHGTLDGKVTVVSRDSFTSAERADAPSDATGTAPAQTAPYYRVRIAIPDPHLRNVNPRFKLIPGMTATAEIKVGSRRLITYLLYPLLRGIDESFREP